MKRQPSLANLTVNIQSVPAEPVHSWRHLTAEEKKTSSASWVCDRCGKTDHAMFYSEEPGEVCKPPAKMSAAQALNLVLQKRYTNYPFTVKTVKPLKPLKGQRPNQERFSVLFHDSYKIAFTVTKITASRFEVEVTKILC